MFDIFIECLKFSTALLCCILVVLGFRDMPRDRILAIRIFAILSIAVYVMHDFSAWPPNILSITPHIGLLILIPVWWCALSLFDDDFSMRKQDWIIAAFWPLLLILAFINVETKFKLVSSVAVSLYVAGLIIYIAFQIWQRWQDDLIESRRKLRLIFAGIIAFNIVISTPYLWVGYFHVDPTFHSNGRTFVNFASILSTVIWSTALNNNNILPIHAPHVPEKPRPRKNLDHLDLHFSKLQALLATHIHREHALSVPKLAKKLNITEHMLRRLISEKMGYKNFRHFINTYRLEEVKDALADPNKSHVSIITIALDAGFNSIPTFNRFFKNEMGMSPSAYRAEQNQHYPLGHK